MTKKRPKFGAIPTLNMPQKSFEKVPTTPRPARPVVKEHPAVDVSTVNRVCHKSLKSYLFVRIYNIFHNIQFDDKVCTFFKGSYWGKEWSMSSLNASVKTLSRSTLEISAK